MLISLLVDLAKDPLLKGDGHAVHEVGLALLGPLSLLLLCLHLAHVALVAGDRTSRGG